MSKFHTGDVVRIICKPGKCYDADIHREMYTYDGLVATVKYVYYSKTTRWETCTLYKLSNNKYGWSYDMLTLLKGGRKVIDNE